jgi:hypothetical protein
MVKAINPLGELVEVPSDLFKIKDEIEYRWTNLKVQYLDPDRAGVVDPPYRIIEMTPTGTVQVLAVWELNPLVVDQLHMMNSHAGIDVQAELEKHNAKVKANKAYEHDQVNSERAEISASAISHFGKGKIQFNYTNDTGEKRIIQEGHSGAKETKVL